MDKSIIILEDFYKSIANRPPRKHETTITTFNRGIYYYKSDTSTNFTTNSRVTYADHRKAIETAIFMFNKRTQHEIALIILTHRFFKQYRATAFSSDSTFTADYSTIISRIAMLFNPATSTIKPIDLRASLRKFTEPTLVQINHVTGEVNEVAVPDTSVTLNEWAVKFNRIASPTCSYRLAGLTI